MKSYFNKYAEYQLIRTIRISERLEKHREWFNYILES